MTLPARLSRHARAAVTLLGVWLAWLGRASAAMLGVWLTRLGRASVAMLGPSVARLGPWVARLRASAGQRVQNSVTGAAVQLAAIAIITLSWTASFLSEPYSASRAVVPVALVLGLLAWRLPERRVWLIGACAGVTNAFVPDAVLLWFAAVGLVFLGFWFSSGRAVWVAPALGAGGAVLGTVWFPYESTASSFVAVILGTAFGLAASSYEQRGFLVRETRELRVRTQASEEQARWLEQRTSLARELHDVVGHHVTAMVVQAEAGKVGTSDTAYDALDAVADLGRTALGELDSLVVHLRDPDGAAATAPAPRLEDIELVLATPLRRQGVDVDVHLDEDLLHEAALAEIEKLTVYRIVQECLTNVARHAQANQAWVDVVLMQEQVRVRVSDDGSGPPTLESHGSGLLGIGERVGALRGMWVISSRPGGGTTVDAFLPVRRVEVRR